MKFTKTSFPELFIVEPEIFHDERGYFYESYNALTFNYAIGNFTFVQDNQAFSQYGIIRGLHYQSAPYTQTKLVRVLKGKILDVVVDIRTGSPAFGKVFTQILSDENKLQLLVPKGFAHGYSVLSDTAEVLYKCDAFYHKPSESGILYNDSELNIDWKIPANKITVSEKDASLPSFSEVTHRSKLFDYNS